MTECQGQGSQACAMHRKAWSSHIGCHGVLVQGSLDFVRHGCILAPLPLALHSLREGSDLFVMTLSLHLFDDVGEVLIDHAARVVVRCLASSAQALLVFRTNTHSQHDELHARSTDSCTTSEQNPGKRGAYVWQCSLTWESYAGSRQNHDEWLVRLEAPSVGKQEKHCCAMCCSLPPLRSNCPWEPSWHTRGMPRKKAAHQCKDKVRTRCARLVAAALVPLVHSHAVKAHGSTQSVQQLPRRCVASLLR